MRQSINGVGVSVRVLQQMADSLNNMGGISLELSKVHLLPLC